jgi:hypothetical protein
MKLSAKIAVRGRMIRAQETMIQSAEKRINDILSHLEQYEFSVTGLQFKKDTNGFDVLIEGKTTIPAAHEMKHFIP